MSDMKTVEDPKVDAATNDIMKQRPRVRLITACRKTVQEAQYEPFSIEVGVQFEADGPFDFAASIASMSRDAQDAIDNELFRRNRTRCPHGFRFGTDYNTMSDCDRCDKERLRLCSEAVPRRRGR